MTARHTSLGEKATIRATIGPATAVTEKHLLVTMIAMEAAIHLGMQLAVHAVAAKLTYRCWADVLLRSRLRQRLYCKDSRKALSSQIAYFYLKRLSFPLCPRLMIRKTDLR